MELLTAFGRVLFKLLHLARFEYWLTQAPPAIAVIAFMIPLAIVAPINVAAVWLLAHGLIIRAVVVEIFAKLLGTLLLARVFALTKNQLLTFRWFAVLYTTITRWLLWAHDRVAATTVYRLAKEFKASLTEKWRGR